jgi:hypothetical protein
MFGLSKVAQALLCVDVNILYVKLACDDSHLPVVQARNLIVFVRSELSRVTARAVVGVVEAHWG